MHTFHSVLSFFTASGSIRPPLSEIQLKMLKSTLLLTLSILGANGSLLDPLLPLVKAIDLVTAVNAEIQRYQRLIDDGVAVKPVGWDEAITTPLITLPGGLIINAGAVALPAPFLCNQTGIVYRLNCRIGANDCTYVHNTYSGKCGKVANPVPGTNQGDGQVFICNDQNPTGYNFANLSDVNQCGPLLGGDLDKDLDTALILELRARFAADLCPANLNSVGCTSDCRNNHQYANGTCVNDAVPSAVYTGQLDTGYKCLCSL